MSNDFKDVMYLFVTSGVTVLSWLYLFRARKAYYSERQLCKTYQNVTVGRNKQGDFEMKVLQITEIKVNNIADIEKIIITSSGKYNIDQTLSNDISTQVADYLKQLPASNSVEIRQNRSTASRERKVQEAF